ncbi:MAG: hypothetical protein DLM72_17665 [Candidatus Nitrosopolaris wilkensis]|nr:MAG: hypothetical protein DLM72_17665 [Candidatus Nitrosopolaris wilkensis]
MGTVAFILSIVIFPVSTIFYPSREDPTNHLRVFAEYAQSNIWIAAHIGQLAGRIAGLGGGFVALYPLFGSNIRIRSCFRTGMVRSCSNNNYSWHLRDTTSCK